MPRKRRNTEVESREERLGFDQLFHSQTERLYKRLDEHQRAYASAIRQYKVVCVDEKAGTGKTTIAVLVGVELLRLGDVDRILYVRFPDARTQRLGYVPGEVSDKEALYMLPFYDAMAECGIQPEAVDKLRQTGVVECATDITMRGRNLKRAYLIIDEAQNGTLEDLRLILTRLHDDGGKCVLIGHSGQMDGKIPRYGRDKLNAFQVYQYHLTKKTWATVCKLPVNYRGSISQWADEVEKSLVELGAAQ